jgi:hypothetical protein
MTGVLRGAIGVFDSGVGGLSTLRAIHEAYPHEHLIYVADSGHALTVISRRAGSSNGPSASLSFFWINRARRWWLLATRPVCWRCQRCAR